MTTAARVALFVGWGCCKGAGSTTHGHTHVLPSPCCVHVHQWLLWKDVKGILRILENYLSPFEFSCIAFFVKNISRRRRGSSLCTALHLLENPVVAWKELQQQGVHQKTHNVCESHTLSSPSSNTPLCIQALCPTSKW